MISAKSVTDTRQAVGYSQTKAAALADVAPNTWRVFEAAPSAVSDKVRSKCLRALMTMRGDASL